MTRTIQWSEIEAEANASGYRERLVEVFRRYEGQPTDEKDAQRRTVKVTAASFARHMGIDEATFARWAKNVVRTVQPEDKTAERARLARSNARQLPAEERGELARELLNDPEVAKAVAADPDAREAVQAAYVHTSEYKEATRDQERHRKEDQARESEVQRTLGGPRAMAALFEVDAAFSMEGIARTTEGIEVARLSAQWLRTIAIRLEAWADGVTEPMSDADFAAGIEAITRSQS